MSKQNKTVFGAQKQESTWLNRVLANKGKQAFVRGVVASAMMIPLWVPAQTGHAGGPASLSAEDAQKYIRDFSIQVTDGKASIAGQIFKDCKKEIEVRAFEEAAGSTDNFVILDKGKFKTCMEKHKAESCLTAKKGSCVDITSPSLTIEGDEADIHLIQTVDGKDKAIKLVSYESADHRQKREDAARAATEAAARTEASRKAEADARAEESHKRESARAEVRALERQFQSCRKDLSEIELARDAVGQLGNLNHLDASAMDDMLAELDKAEIDSFEKKIRKARDADKLDDLEDELVEFADAKCEQSDRLGEELESAQDDAEEEDSSDKIERAEARMERQIDDVAALFHQLAVKRVSLGRDGKDGESKPDPVAENRAAAKTIELARKIDCLPKQTKTELNRIQRDLSVDRCTIIAQQGSAYAFDLQQCMQNVSYGLAMDVQKYCAGASANGMDCASARRAQMTVSQQIPNLYNQAVKKEQAQAQAMYQSFSAPPATATAGMPLLPNTGGSGYSWNGTQL